jgi:hypothetical protein
VPLTYKAAEFVGAHARWCGVTSCRCCVGTVMHAHMFSQYTYANTHALTRTHTRSLTHTHTHTHTHANTHTHTRTHTEHSACQPDVERDGHDEQLLLQSAATPFHGRQRCLGRAFPAPCSGGNWRAGGRGVAGGGQHEDAGVCVHVCVHLCVCVSMCVCVRAFVCIFGTPLKWELASGATHG